MAFTIMVIDDSKTTRKLFENILPTLFKTQIDVIQAVDGDDAVMLLDDNPDVDLVFLDINMPGMDGYEVLEMINFKASLAHIKVIIASTESSDDVIEDFINRGASGFIVKPITKTNILNTLIAMKDDIDIELDVNDAIKDSIQKQDNKNVINILVVDDSKTIQKMYSFNLPRLFDKTAVNLYSANNGKEALEMLEKKPDTDVVFLDINMPVMDGFEFLKVIKELPIFNSIKIITASTEDSAEAIKGMYLAGASGYLVKPFKLKTLFNTLDRLNSEYNLGFQLKTSDLPKDSVAMFNQAPLKILIADDSKTIRKMYNGFLPKVINKQIEIFEANDGKEALDILAKTPDISLIFLDQNMPNMDGKQALKTIKIQPKFKNIKVVMCTADENIDHKQAMILDGSDGYIVKPFTKDALYEVLKSFNPNIVNEN